MSKTEMRLFAAVETLLKTISQHETPIASARFNTGSLRDAFKLTSFGKKQLANKIEDVLTTDAIVDQFGFWCLAEAEHPVYQLNRAADHRIELSYKEGSSALSAAVFLEEAPKPKVNIASQTEVQSQSENWQNAYNRMSKELRAAFTSDQLKLLWENNAFGDGGTECSIAELKEELERLSWEADLAGFGPELKLEFNVAELEVLWLKGLIGGVNDPCHSLEYLKAQLAYHNHVSGKKLREADNAYYKRIKPIFNTEDWKRLLREGLVGPNADSPALSVEKLYEALEPKQTPVKDKVVKPETEKVTKVKVAKESKNVKPKKVK